MRRRRHYDATGVRQRESLMEAADLLRAEGADLAAAVRVAARRARAHRAPDRGDAPLRARPPAARRALLDAARRPAHRPLAPARAAGRAARGADALVADRRGPARAPDGRGRGPPQPLLLRGDAARRGARGARGARALASTSASTAASWRSAPGPARTWTAIPRSAPRRSRARSRCTAAPALRLLRARVDALARASPTRAAARPSPPRCEASLERDAAELPSARVLRRANREFEPLRTKLGFIAHRLDNMLDPLAREPGYADPQELRDDLWLVLDSVGSAHVAHGALRRLLWQVDVFGFHVAALDVRQSAAVVQEAVAALLPGYRDADEEERARLLAEAISEGRRGLERRPEGPPASCCACSTRSRSRARPTASAPCPVMVISMVERAVRRARRAVARAAAPARSCGSCRCSRRSPTSRARRRRWRTLYDTPVYRDSLRAHGDRQVIMLGYSDSGKDSGFVSSQWALHDAQERLAAQAAEHGLELSSSTAAAARPRAAAAARTARSSPSRAARCAAASGSPSRARPSRPATATRSWPCARSSRRSPRCCWPRRASSRRSRPRGARRWSGWRSARASATAALVYEDPDFPRFFEQATPITELTSLNIGSRPSKRSRGRDRGAAGDPVGVRVDAEPAAAAVLVRRGRRAGRGRPRAAARDGGAAGRSSRRCSRRSRWRSTRPTSASRSATCGSSSPSCATASGPPSRASTTSSSGGCWRSRARAALLDDPPAAAAAALAPQPVDRPALAPPGRAARPRARRAGATRASRCWRRSPASRRACATRAEAARRSIRSSRRFATGQPVL